MRMTQFSITFNLLLHVALEEFLLTIEILLLYRETELHAIERLVLFYTLISYKADDKILSVHMYINHFSCFARQSMKYRRKLKGYVGREGKGENKMLTVSFLC